MTATFIDALELPSQSVIMGEWSSTRNGPATPNQLGKLIVDLSVGAVLEANLPKDSPAVEFARQGGLKGGKARAEALTPERRRAIAQAAARRRWGSKSE